MNRPGPYEAPQYPSTINEYLDAYPDTDDLGVPWDDNDRDRFSLGGRDGLVASSARAYPKPSLCSGGSGAATLDVSSPGALNAGAA